MSHIRSVAVVLPRYGDSLGGGAETLVQSLLRRVVQTGAVTSAEVWTTCAKDHRTWDNFYPEGVTTDGSITVRRFPVDPRNTDIFISAELAMRDGRRLQIKEQLDWLENSVNSNALYLHIAEHGRAFDAILFAPYLFATSFWGALIYPERSILVPCLHNEQYAYLDVVRYLFERVAGLVFNAEPELQLAAEIFTGLDVLEKGTVVGMGFEPPQQSIPSEADWSRFCRERGISHPYLLYSGRKEEGKNLDLLIRYFEQTGLHDKLQLVIIGSGEINFRSQLPTGVSDLGFVSEAEKAALMANAVALVQPSTNESFSIVMMEAWQRRTPVLVHADCLVTRDHVQRSGGGLYFSSAPEFHLVVKRLLDDAECRRAMGEAGANYVATMYSWEAVDQRLGEAFQKFLARSSQVNEANGESRKEIDSEGKLAVSL